MSMDQLRKKRKTVKTKLTNFKNYVLSINNLNTNIPIAELETRLSKAESLIHDFELIQDEIDCLSNDLSQEENIRKEFEDNYYSSIASSRAILTKFHNVCSNNSAQNFNVKLPTIELPKFEGEFDKWLDFHDSFESLINKNSALSAIQRFHYLRASISGNASKIISSLPVSADNFDMAWKLICERYENKNLLIYSHIKAIFDIPKIHKESWQPLRQLTDGVSSNLRSLKSLGQPIEHWDSLLVYIVVSKLDSNSEREWESAKNESFTFDDLLDFLKKRASILENRSFKHNENDNSHKSSIKFKQSKSFISTEFKCQICSNSHKILNCPEFLKLDVRKRAETAKRYKLCLNCLHSGHINKGCVFGKCQKCGMKHHTLLHIDQISSQSTSESPGTSFQQPSSQVSTSYSSYFTEAQVLLGTVSVLVYDSHGKSYSCKAVLDSGSQSNFISEDLCHKLGVQKQNIDLAVCGIGQVFSHIDSKCSVTLHAVHSNFTLTLSCLIMKEISGRLPSEGIDISALKIPPNIRLADPTFYSPSKIDILIGSASFWDLLSVGQIRLGNSLPTLQKTRFGWIVSGPLPGSSIQTSQCNFSQNNTSQELSRFWEIEECFSSEYVLSQEEKDSENHFISNFQRTHEGRFVVSIPFRSPPSLLGDSKLGATKLFFKTERRLSSNPKLKQEYSDFLQEYIDLGHMSKSPLQDINVSYFLPHHAVLKEDSLTTKLRVVFNGSFPSTSGLSVNDLQMDCPVIQSDLFSILLRFRQHTFVISADIEKMFRQVDVDPSQRYLQQILWRFNTNDELTPFQLNTITYGTKTASFLATRCILQLSRDFGNEFPEACKIIQSDFYMDDLLTGSDSAPVLSRLCIEIYNILRSGCFPLRKWVSNDPAIIQGLNPTSNDSNFLQLGENTKILGLVWCCDSDLLIYKIIPPTSATSTKRSILSNIAQVFDPLGLLAPCVIKVKILIQKIWAEQLDWDQSVPLSIHTEWLSFRDQLSSLNDLRIPRHFKCNDFVGIQMHGFCDSSEQAYGACIYIRSIDSSGGTTVRLLCAKSRVAPLKTITLPRLELCGALLLSRLANKVVTSLSLKVNEIFYWSDSTIVLGWIRTSPSSLKTFVANRVTEITSLTSSDRWAHVPSKQNPADLLTRGVAPLSLVTNDFWWEGPSFLSQNPIASPIQPNYSTELPEMKLNAVSLVVIRARNFPFCNFSTFIHLKRTVAYCLRFLHNTKVSNATRKRSGSLSIEELQMAELSLIRIAQSQVFKPEIELLLSNKPLPAKSYILSLSPFLDAHGILRVGGRLGNSTFPEDKKHPILLPPKHLLTKLILQDLHHKSCHCGPQQLLHLVREKYWPIHGKNTAKKIVRDCITCFRSNPSSTNPIMADLPNYRVQPSFPFLVTGVDYAGPFLLKDRRGKGYKKYKGYVSLFICLSTKSIHLELVSDLTTQTFISALKRFISRRGKPNQIFSDNGTNFVGSRNELRSLYEFFKSNQSNILDECNSQEINWKFIPSYSPHFGGIWEAGVRAMKSHLKRVLKNSLLVYEDFQTILIQIEGILNSRPLSPLSNDPTDLNPLTPSHFLLGRPLQAIPERDLTDIQENRLKSYHRLQCLKQHFWKRWSVEFISELQQRLKWKKQQQNIQPGTLVVIKDKQLPPQSWLLGRIETLHPGSDGITRVVSVRTSKGILLRAVVNVCPLPISD